MDQYGDYLSSQIMVAPHHGSKTSSSYRFIDLVNPETVVFSAGYRNRYGFPHATISQRYHQQGVKRVDTIHQGAVTFLVDIDSGQIKQSSYRQDHKHYWQLRAQ